MNAHTASNREELASYTTGQLEALVDLGLATRESRASASPDVPGSPVVRQYVGARYIPLIIGEWPGSGRDYEAFSVVLYQGNSYIARTTVPVGIEVTDETYWALFSNYNAQIDAYRKEVQAFDGRITAAQSTADSANDTANIANNTAGDALSTATNAETTANANKLAVDNLKIATANGLVIFGDSWTTSGNSWPQKYAKATNKTFTKSYGVIGATFLNRPSNLISSQLNSARQDTDINKNEVKEVIIIGGVNDYRDNDNNASDVGAAIASLVNDIADIYPNAHIRYFLNCQIFGYPHTWMASFSTSCFNKGFSAFSLAPYLLFNTYAYETDNLHLNTSGNNILTTLLQTPQAMSYSTDFISQITGTGCSVSSPLIRIVNGKIVGRLTVAVNGGSGSINFPQNVKGVLVDRAYTMTEVYTNNNAGLYSVNYDGSGIAIGSTAKAGTDYLTFQTEMI